MLDTNRIEWLEERNREYTKIAGKVVKLIESGDVTPGYTADSLIGLLVKAGWMDEPDDY